MYIHLGGARGVVVIVGKEPGYPSSNTEQVYCSYSANVLRRGTNSTILPASSYG